jgi:uncharacterized protein GlcG (DUF336 family)
MADGHTRDIQLARARELIQNAIDKAEQLGLRGGIAVAGASGALVSTSRMDRGGAAGWRVPVLRPGSRPPRRDR